MFIRSGVGGIRLKINFVVQENSIEFIDLEGLCGFKRNQVKRATSVLNSNVKRIIAPIHYKFRQKIIATSWTSRYRPFKYLSEKCSGSLKSRWLRYQKDKHCEVNHTSPTSSLLKRLCLRLCLSRFSRFVIIFYLLKPWTLSYYFYEVFLPRHDALCGSKETNRMHEKSGTELWSFCALITLANDTPIPILWAPNIFSS